MNLTKGHAPKEVFSLVLDERAFSVWSVTPSDNGEALLFQTHALCRVRPEINEFTMMVNALPQIALTAVSDWQQAQTLMVNTYQKINPTNKSNIPFKGVVYPADLVMKTTQLEKENAYQKFNPTNKSNIPFKGVVYPADLVMKTTQLEKENALQD